MGRRGMATKKGGGGGKGVKAISKPPGRKSASTAQSPSTRAARKSSRAARKSSPRARAKGSEDESNEHEVEVVAAEVEVGGALDEVGTVRLNALLEYCFDDLSRPKRDGQEFYPFQFWARCRIVGGGYANWWNCMFFDDDTGELEPPVYRLKISTKNFNFDRLAPEGGWRFVSGQENETMRGNGGDLVLSEAVLARCRQHRAAMSKRG